MSFLSQLPKTVIPRKKRVGRGLGSGKGAKSGRGTTRHQAARESISVWFEGGQNKFTKKFPLLRGKARNKSKKQETITVQLSKVATLPANTAVTVETLIKNEIINKPVRKNQVKIVGVADIKHPLEIGVLISKSAFERVAKAGGKKI